MFEYTQNNHITAGIRNGEFFFEYGKIAGHTTWREECKLAAAELYEKHGDKLILCLSGGVDSETVLNSFTAIGIKPKVAIMRYERNNNLHDINYAFRVAAKNYISPIIIDVDVPKFFENELLDFAEVSQCSSPQVNLLMYHANKLDGIPVLGTGENFLTRKYGEIEVYDLECQKETNLYTYFQSINRECIPAFFQYTPAQMVSFLQKESVYRWVETAKKNKFISTKKVKHILMNEDFDLEARPKLTGFEMYNELDSEYRTLLENKNFNDTGEIYTEFTEYIKSFGIEPLRPITYET
jgi:hypothetical protein